MAEVAARERRTRGATLRIIVEGPDDGNYRISWKERKERLWVGEELPPRFKANL